MSTCECGCGGAPPLATRTRKDLGHVRGEPVRFINGHNRRLGLNSAEMDARVLRQRRAWYWRNLVPERLRMRLRKAARLREFDDESRAWVGVLDSDPCCYCGAEMDEIDHIVSAAVGGTGRWDNLTAACRRCNASKKEFPLLMFLDRRNGWLL